jgi:hypothetical protein
MPPGLVGWLARYRVGQLAVTATKMSMDSGIHGSEAVRV